MIRSRRRTLALQIAPDATLVIRAPHHLAQEEIDRFVTQKTAWITKNQRLMRERPPAPRREFTHGEAHLYLGEAYNLLLVDQAATPLVFSDGAFRLDRGYLDKARELFKSWYRYQAQQLIAARAQYYAKHYGFEYLRIRLTDTASRWGSCSARGVLSFNWRLVMAPMTIVDYLIVHELVHLHERHHQRAFWQKVEAIFPGCHDARVWLKTNQRRLEF